MKVLFLLTTFIPFIFTVQAQRNFESYTCQVSHKHSQVAFYLGVGETKEIEIGGWNVMAGIKRIDNFMEVSLERSVEVMDATYQKAARRTYSFNSRRLPVDLTHTFGGRTDIFSMVCMPRDP